MVALYVIGGLLLLFALLLFSPLKIMVSCRENEFHLTIKYILFRKKILPSSRKTKKEVPDKKKSSEKKARKEKKKTAGNTENAKKKKRLLPDNKSDLIALIVNIMNSSKKALSRFTKGVSITGIKADIDISDEDACDCAVKFGKANIIVYNILSFCDIFFKVKKKYINIRCVYNKPESVYNFSFTVKFTLNTLILSSAAFIFTFLVNNKKAKKKVQTV